MCCQQELINELKKLGMSKNEVKFISNLNDWEIINYCVIAWREAGIRGNDLKKIPKIVHDVTEKYKPHIEYTLKTDMAVPFDSMKYIVLSYREDEILNEIRKMAIKKASSEGKNTIFKKN